jgi:hypothetical protein
MSTKTAKLRGAKVVSALLALAMALALTPAAPRAAWGDTTATISSSSTASHTITMTFSENSSRTYQVFQVFTADYSATKTTDENGKEIFSDEKLANVKWGSGVASYNTYVENTPTANSVNSGDAVPETIKNALVAVNETSGKTDAEQVAEFEKYININESSTTVLSSTNKSVSVTTGYYLIKETTKGLTSGQAASLILVKVLGHDITITPKDGSTVDSQNLVTSEILINGKKSDTVNRNATATFKMSATISASDDGYDNYSAFKMVFNNTIGEGLTFKEITSVKYFNGSTEGTFSSDEYNSSTDNNGNLSVTFTDLTTNSNIKAGTTIVVEYTATVQDDIVLNGSSNASKLTVNYTNDPNPGVTSTGDTARDSAYVYSYKLVVTSNDASGGVLKDAAFTLYKKNGESFETTGTTKSVDDTTGKAIFNVEPGTYKLVESTVPTGYNKIDDIEFTVEATEDTTTAGTLTSLAATETTSTNTTFGSTQDNGSYTGEITTTVAHTAGALFPVSGGVGTTMFYLVGGCMIVAACVALTAYRKRRLSRVIAGK